MAVTTYAVRADVEQKVGFVNLAVYADINSNEDAGEITAAISDDIIEAATDMHVAWREFSDTPLPAIADLNDVEARWMLDTNAYGAAVKAYMGRNVDEGENASVPKLVGTAMDEWARRLGMLRDGTALQDWQEDEGIEEDDENAVGTFQEVDLTFDPADTCDKYSG